MTTAIIFTTGLILGMAWGMAISHPRHPQSVTRWTVAGEWFHCAADAENYRQWIESQSGVDVGIGTVTTREER
jgi:hypothetical protein